MTERIRPTPGGDGRHRRPRPRPVDRQAASPVDSPTPVDDFIEFLAELIAKKALREAESESA